MARLKEHNFGVGPKHCMINSVSVREIRPVINKPLTLANQDLLGVLGAQTR